MTIRRKPALLTRRDRSDEFASHELPAPTPARMATSSDFEVMPAGRASAALKAPRRDTGIRESARGERCLVRLPGCPDDPAMTIWSHCRHGRGGKGMGIKALDVLGAYCCTYCDSIYDGQRPRPEGASMIGVELAWWMAHAESLVILRSKGLI